VFLFSGLALTNDEPTTNDMTTADWRFGRGSWIFFWVVVWDWPGVERKQTERLK
jgi:hypothetical protein